MRVMSSQRINGSTLVLPIEHCKRRHRQKRDKVRPGKKMPDARRGRNWTRAMEKWAKPPTRHRRVHGPVHGPRTGGTWTREKSARRPSWTELDACHEKQAKTTDEAPTRTRTRTRTQTGRYGDTGKKVPDARRGRYWTRTMENWAKPPTRHRRVHGPRNGYEGSGKKRPIRHGNRAKTS